MEGHLMSNEEHIAFVERKLTAIFSADVAGYSRLMSEDEIGTLRTLTTYRGVTDSLIQQQRGRIVNTAGDSILAEFASAVDAVQCAVAIQQALGAKNAALPVHRKMEFRIGLNVGDVMVEGKEIYGDGVNVAARVQSLADPGGVFLSGTVYDQIESKLPLAYEYLGEQEVKNIAKPVRMYRVVREVPSPLVEQASSLHAARMAAPPEGQGEGASGRAGTVTSPHPDLPPQGGKEPKRPAQGLPLPDKPSIAVLPFINMSSDPEQEYFSDGITEDLITDLSRLSGLFVIARNSTFTYKGKAVKVEDVGRELGVRYVLEGSVRKAANRVRITAQLVDATTSHHLWAERYDRDLVDIFVLQDEITHQIVTALRVEMQEAELERVRRTPTENLTAYDYVLRGWDYYNRITEETNLQARQMFEKAIQLDPQYAEAYVGVGWTYWMEWVWYWSRDPQTPELAFTLVLLCQSP
jgi:TolB-like protein/class 3 adenylate cyclase